MFNFSGEMNSQIQMVDIKVMANNRIKLGQPALDLLGLNDGTKHFFCEKDRTTGTYFVAAITVVKDGDTIVSPGKKINKEGAFGHQSLNHSLGGQYSEWTINKEGVQEFEGVDYYPIDCAIEGATKRAELAKAAGTSTEVEEVVEEEKVVDIDDDQEPLLEK